MPSQNNLNQKIEKPVLDKIKDIFVEKPKPEHQVEQVDLSGVEKAAAEQAAMISEQLSEGGLAGASQARQQAQARLKEVENVLAEDMEDIYVKLTPDKQEEFKRVGEETAQKITKILESAKISLRQIISLIRKWLSVVPGLNRFFLEQEAKIKADEIIRIKKEAGK